MDRNNVLLGLLLTFAPLSLLTIGGGLSIVGDIQRSAVGDHHWLTAQGFADLFAISRVAPGPGTLLVTLVGWHVGGWLGAVVATLAIFLPSSLLVFGVARLWHRRPGARWQRVVASGLAPVAAGLVLSSVQSLLFEAKGGWAAWTTAAAVAVLSLRTQIAPLLLLALGAVALFLVGTVIELPT